MTRRFEPPQSMRFVAEKIPAFVKARTHHNKADELNEPNQVFLERFKGLEFLYREVAPKVKKHDAFVFARESSEVQILCACLAQLSRPRLDAILALPAIADLNVALSKKNMAALIADNEMLQDLEISQQTWLQARKDLRFALKSNTQKALAAIATLLLIVRAACDPKVKKQLHLVKDGASLESANALLKDCVVHLVEHFTKETQRFFEPSFRKPMTRV